MKITHYTFKKEMIDQSDINDTVDYIDINFSLVDVNEKVIHEKVVEKMKISSSLIYDLNSLSDYDANDFAIIHTDIIEKELHWRFPTYDNRDWERYDNKELIKSALVKLFLPIVQLFKTGKIDTDTIIASETDVNGIKYVFSIDKKNVEKIVNLVKIQKDYVRPKPKSKSKK